MNKQDAFIVTAGVFFAVVARFKRNDKRSITNAELLDALKDLATRKTAKDNAECKTARELDCRGKTAVHCKTDEVTASQFKSCTRKDVHDGLLTKRRVAAFKKNVSTPKGMKKRLKRTEKFMKENLVGDRGKIKQLLNCLRHIVDRDDTIEDKETVSFFPDGAPMSKSELLAASELCPEAVLLGMWYYVLCRVVDKNIDNRKGKAAYEELFPKPHKNKSRRVWDKSIDLSRYGDFKLVGTDFKTGNKGMNKLFEIALTEEDAVAEIETAVLNALDDTNKIVSKTDKRKYAGKSSHHLLLAYCELVALRRLKALSKDQKASAAILEETIENDIGKQLDKYVKASFRMRQAMDNNEKTREKV